MTSKAQRRAGYLLPEVISGHDLMLVCLCIPNTVEYRAAFRGAIYELSKPWNWEASGSADYPRQREAATLWLTVIEEYLNMPCNICELVAACIENMLPGDPLYDALHDWLVGQLTNEQDIQDIINSGGSGSSASPLAGAAMIAECNQDLLFGFCRQLVQFLNQAITDFYENLELLTNFEEFFAAVTPEISFIGMVLEYVHFLQDALAENYIGNYDINLENQYACDIFCLAQELENCTLTWADLTHYFLGRVGTELADNDIFDILSTLGTGAWLGYEYCHVAMATICAVLHFSGEFTGLDLSLISNLWLSWSNDPDSDWSVLCSCEWDVLYQFEFEDAKGWNVVEGQWYPGEQRLSSVNVPGVKCRLIFDRTFSPTIGILTDVWCTGTAIQYSGTHVGAGVYLTITHQGGTYTDTYLGNPDGQNVEFVLPVPLDGVSYIKLEVREDLVGDGGYCRANGVKLFGHGGTPPPPPPP